MWHKLSPKACGYRLAITGAIKDAVVEYEDLAYFAVDFLRQAYPSALQQRYKLRAVAEDPMQIIEDIARRRGCIQKGGIVNLHKVSELLIHEIRQGTLGKLSLEWPSHLSFPNSGS